MSTSACQPGYPAAASRKAHLRIPPLGWRYLVGFRVSQDEGYLWGVPIVFWGSIFRSPMFRETMYHLVATIHEDVHVFSLWL